MTLRAATPSLLARHLGRPLIGSGRVGSLCGAFCGAVVLTFASGTVGFAQVEGVQTEAATAEQQALQSAIASPALPTPAPAPFSPVVSGIVDLAAGAETIAGVGHLRPQETGESSANRASWLQSVILPLYVSPGGEHWGWIYRGWLIPQGQDALAIGRDAGFAMVRTDENLFTFPVLEVRDDGWIQVQYTSLGSAWVHSSQLAMGEPLVVERWEDRLQAQDAVYFLQNSKAQALRSQPEIATNMLSLVAADSLIEPLSFEGDWMQVRVTRPAANCRPLTGATVTEGWMRWRSSEQASLVWYRPGSRCVAER